MTTASFFLPLLYRVPAGRPATPPQGSALALGFISESSGTLASSHKAEGQPSQASSRGVEALRASGPSSWAPGATTGRRTVQRDDGLDGGQGGGAAGGGQPAPRGTGVAAHDGGQIGGGQPAPRTQYSSSLSLSAYLLWLRSGNPAFERRGGESRRLAACRIALLAGAAGLSCLCFRERPSSADMDEES